MKIHLQVGPYTIDGKKNITLKDDGEFTVVTIDRDSYIVDADVWFMFEKQEGQYPYNLQIGKYTSIAWNVQFLMDMNHNYKAACQGEARELRGCHKQQIRHKGQILIGNDCWIGEGATIFSGVTIHSGALVAASAVVTRDVPPYTIVAGNPARVIGNRFPDHIIVELLKIRWWDWDSAKIEENKELLSGNIEEFVKVHRVEDQAVEKRLEIPYNLEKTKTYERYLFFAEDQGKYANDFYVIESFIRKFPSMDAELLLAIAKDQSREANLERIFAILSEFENSDSSIRIYEYDKEEEYLLFYEADHYITSRSPYGVERMEMGREAGISMMSGVDSPLF